MIGSRRIRGALVIAQCWLSHNKRWLFSGMGTALTILFLSWFLLPLIKKPVSQSPRTSTTPTTTVSSVKSVPHEPEPKPPRRTPVELRERSERETRHKVMAPTITATNGSVAIGGNNSGSVTVNNFPPPRTISDPQHFVDMLSKTPGRISRVDLTTRDYEAYQLATTLLKRLREAGWTTPPTILNVISGEVAFPGIVLVIHGAPVPNGTQIEIPRNDPTYPSLLTLLSSLSTITSLRIGISRDLSVPDGAIRILVGPRD